MKMTKFSWKLSRKRKCIRKRMVLQNKSDNSNGHVLKWSKFRLNLSFWRCLSQKRTHFRENFLGNDIFAKMKIFANENLLIFAFRENGKNRFRFKPRLGIKSVLRNVISIKWSKNEVDSANLHAVWAHFFQN
jgi:hypothetical protein